MSTSPSPPLYEITAGGQDLVCLLGKGKGGHPGPDLQQKAPDPALQGPGGERPGDDVDDHHEPGDPPPDPGDAYGSCRHRPGLRPAPGGRMPRGGRSTSRSTATNIWTWQTFPDLRQAPAPRKETLMDHRQARKPAGPSLSAAASSSSSPSSGWAWPWLPWGCC